MSKGRRWWGQPSPCNPCIKGAPGLPLNSPIHSTSVHPVHLICVHCVAFPLWRLFFSSPIWIGVEVPSSPSRRKVMQSIGPPAMEVLFPSSSAPVVLLRRPAHACVDGALLCSGEMPPVLAVINAPPGHVRMRRTVPPVACSTRTIRCARLSDP